MTTQQFFEIVFAERTAKMVVLGALAITVLSGLGISIDSLYAWREQLSVLVAGM